MTNRGEGMLRCHYCRTENPVGSSACWLCEAGDWNPTLHTPSPLKGGDEVVFIGADEPTLMPLAPARRGKVFSFLAAVFTTIALVGVTLLIFAGLRDSAPGLATVLMLAWWLALGTAVWRRNQHPGAANAFLVVVSAIGMVFAGIVVLGVSLIALLLLVCFAAAPPNFH